jgi:ABC-type branched-subunit amino acid transport system substrate-binding protein
MLLTVLFVNLLPAPAPAQENMIDKSGKVVIIQGKEYYLHKVKKGQTLYSISKTYNVTLDDIYRENKEAEQGLKTGQELKIPVIKEVKKPELRAETQPLVKPDSLVAPEITRKCEKSIHREAINVALMMPLYLSEIDSINPYRETDSVSASSFKSLRFLPFYEGFRVALDSMEKAGFSCNLFVYDVDDDSLRIKKVLKKPEFDKMDIIFGLLYGNVFSIVSEFADKHNIPIINPLSNRLPYIEGKPGVFLANPSVNTMSVEIARFIREKFLAETVILVNPGRENEKRSMAKLRENIDILAGLDTIHKQDLRQIASSALQSGSLAAQLSKERKNILVLLSNDELLVANLFRQIKMLDPAYQVIVFGLPGWADYKSIETHDLVTYFFHTYTNSFIDYTDEDTRRFIRKYRQIYFTEPDDNAFRGYDVAFYFLQAMYAYGKDFTPCITDFSQKTLGTRFVFKRQGKNGFENSWLNIIKYEDYSIKDAR